MGFVWNLTWIIVGLAIVFILWAGCASQTTVTDAKPEAEPQKVPSPPTVPEARVVRVAARWPTPLPAYPRYGAYYPNGRGQEGGSYNSRHPDCGPSGIVGDGVSMAPHGDGGGCGYGGGL
jgi:hypothetical protein